MWKIVNQTVLEAEVHLVTITCRSPLSSGDVTENVGVSFEVCVSNQ